MESLGNKLDKLTELLKAMKDKPGVTLRDIGKVQNKLSEVDALYRDGVFLQEGRGRIVPAGQAILSSKLAKAHQLAHSIVCSVPDTTEVDPQLARVVDRLDRVLLKLEQLDEAKEYATLRDIGRIQNDLRDIDLRVRKLSTQYIPGVEDLIDRLEVTYATVHRLVQDIPEWSLDYELVDPALAAAVHKLHTVIDALQDLEARGRASLREVGALQNKMSSVDASYSEARVEKNHKVVRGQAVIAELLEQAHDLAHRLLASSSSNPGQQNIRY